jgi:hypothetical protein
MIVHVRFAPKATVANQNAIRCFVPCMDGARGARGESDEHAASHRPIHYISLPCSPQKPMSISRYIVLAAVKFSRACSDLPLRR